MGVVPPSQIDRGRVVSEDTPRGFSFEEYYVDYPAIENAFAARLDEPLACRGPDIVYEIVADLALATGSLVVDLGCGEGQHAFELARRFGFMALGIDPVQRHIDAANAARDRDPKVGGQLAFCRGAAEHLPVASASVDLVWCREVLYHVANLETRHLDAMQLRAGLQVADFEAEQFVEAYIDAGLPAVHGEWADQVRERTNRARGVVGGRVGHGQQR